jgi:hypothetical protein
MPVCFAISEQMCKQVCAVQPKFSVSRYTEVQQAIALCRLRLYPGVRATPVSQGGKLKVGRFMRRGKASVTSLFPAVLSPVHW